MHHMKKIMEYLNVFRGYIGSRKYVSGEPQTSIYFIKGKLQTSIENILRKKIKDYFG